MQINDICGKQRSDKPEKCYTFWITSRSPNHNREQKKEAMTIHHADKDMTMTENQKSTDSNCWFKRWLWKASNYTAPDRLRQFHNMVI